MASKIALNASTKRLLADTGARVPVVCGPMYPGSNPELVAAVSEAGGFGVVQPISLTRLYKHEDYRKGLQLIKSLTDKPFGVNITILPKSAASAKYAHMNEEFAEIAMEEGVKFLLTSLGKPDEIVKKAHANGVKVYHDVHNAKLAMRAADAGCDGVNLLNNGMGGQTGSFSAEDIIRDVKKMRGEDDFPMLCAGAVSNSTDLRRALDLGYAGAQVGTRFLASTEANITEEYKNAIVGAKKEDIVWTNKLAGTNSSVISTPMVEKGGLRTNAFVTFLLKHPMTKSLTRFYLLKGALDTYEKAAFDPSVEIWQAGKGVDGIKSIETCDEIIKEFERGL